MLETRSLEPEIMDEPHPSPEVARRFHRDLRHIHRALGYAETLARLLDAEPKPTSVLDIGCGDGALLDDLRGRLRLTEAIGIDLKPPACIVDGLTIIAADATRDPLPRADAAVCTLVLHHLSDADAVALIRNVGRSVRRFLVLDLVRHPLPLALFSIFVCPFLSKVGAIDGKQSIRRAFRADEMTELVKEATAGTGATWTHDVTPFWTRQIFDIRWPE